MIIRNQCDHQNNLQMHFLLQEISFIPQKLNVKGKFPNTKSLSHFKWKKRGGAIRNAERFYIIF